MARGVCSPCYNLGCPMLAWQVAALWDSALQAASDSTAFLMPSHACSYNMVFWCCALARP